MPAIEISELPLVKGSKNIGYPPPHDKGCGLYEAAAPGEAAGLTRFGVHIEKLLPGGMSSQRHLHENEDEFLYMLGGEVVLVENNGDHIPAEGMAAGWKAGGRNAYHLINRSGQPAYYRIIGTRADSDTCHYPDIDLHYTRRNGERQFSHKDSTPYQEDKTR